MSGLGHHVAISNALVCNCSTDSDIKVVLCISGMIPSLMKEPPTINPSILDAGYASSTLYLSWSKKGTPGTCDTVQCWLSEPQQDIGILDYVNCALRWNSCPVLQ